MQRRAAAIYATFFVILAAGAYGTIGVAQEPSVGIQNPAYSLTANDTVTIGDTEYLVDDVDENRANLVWVEEGIEFTETWENGSTVALDDTEFTLRIDATRDPPEATLTEVQELDENVTTTEVDDEVFVVVQDNGERRLVPRDEYIRQVQGPPETQSFDERDRVDYQGERTEVSQITNESVTLTWTGSQDNTVRVQHARVTTLGGVDFIAHISDGTTVELSRDIQGYRGQEATLEKFHERINGLWGVSIISSLVAILLLGLAYLPSRY